MALWAYHILVLVNLTKTYLMNRIHMINKFIEICINLLHTSNNARYTLCMAFYFLEYNFTFDISNRSYFAFLALWWGHMIFYPFYIIIIALYIRYF